MKSDPKICTAGLFKGYARLDWINGAACKDDGIVFNNLIYHLHKVNLKQAFHMLDGSKACGIDQVTKDEYGKNLEANIDKLSDEIYRGGWRPRPSREVLIPKANGGTRPLAIGCLEDKIVQNLAAKILEAIFEPLFHNESFGFRPKRNTHQALARLYKEIDTRSETCVVVEMDIEKYFNSISHGKMMELLERKISDKKFLRLIKRMLRNSVISENGQLMSNLTGTPQGSPISPILANIYLHYVLDEWFAEHWLGKGAMVRYADDAVFIFADMETAITFKNELNEQLAKAGGIKLNLDKSGIVKFDKGKPEGEVNFLGFTLYWGYGTKGKKTLKVKTSAKKLALCIQKFKEWIKMVRNRFPLKRIWQLTAAKLRGHYNYYGVTFNYNKIQHYYWICINQLFKWLNRRSQRRSFTWTRFMKRLSFDPLPKPMPGGELLDVTNGLGIVLKHELKSRMRKLRTYGSVRSFGY